MVPSRWRILAIVCLMQPYVPTSRADDPPAVRRQRAQEFHLRAQERTGVLVPLYVYPSDVDRNPAYQPTRWT